MRDGFVSFRVSKERWDGIFKEKSAVKDGIYYTPKRIIEYIKKQLRSKHE